MPVAVASGASARSTSAKVLAIAVGATLVVAVAVIGYSLVKVRRGQWEHVDASHPMERAQLNLFLAVVLLAAAGSLWLLGMPHVLAYGLGIGGALVLLAHALRTHLKASLHVAFAVLASALAWPAAAVATVLAGLALCVAWSRLKLQRHTLREVLVGAILGLGAAVAFHALAFQSTSGGG
jgi:hypothetical protein